MTKTIYLVAKKWLQNNIQDISLNKLNTNPVGIERGMSPQLFDLLNTQHINLINLSFLFQFAI